MTVYRITRVDYDAVRALYEETFDPLTMEDVRAGTIFFGAHGIYSGELVAFGGLAFGENDTAHLEACAVAKDLRGLGLQRKLIKRREQEARKRGYSRMQTYTASGNWRSMRNLVLCGYVPSGADISDETGDFVHFEKVLVK